MATVLGIGRRHRVKTRQPAPKGWSRQHDVSHLQGQEPPTALQGLPPDAAHLTWSEGLLHFRVLPHVALSRVAAVVIRHGGAAESIREGVRAGISTGLLRDKAAEVLPLLTVTLQGPKAHLLSHTLTFLLALPLASRLDLDFRSVGRKQAVSLG